ncbi:E3 ubiquitin-protein ligase MSL2-like [Mya arenaria]|uniref:E3 ubiquitin-protein ligase MSL2-like n=1 Tax=Mya arenaria TaxID=6604 RepID=UPI0022E75182|nr:E3 ubiquitin-protein ligase MSL2-like [Mya arenaria]XP_052785323.1 E3 ubiquitin-protein ligase MSL2-like [Mya arenaria]
MHALDFYTSICRIVMRADPSVPESWSELRSLLPCLRQSLGCYVCFNVLYEPMGPNHNVCKHFVCKNCVGGKMRLKPSCSWCKDHWLFVPNPLLKVLLSCFKKLCTYIHNSPLGEAICSVNMNGETNNLQSILLEGINLLDQCAPSTTEISLHPEPSTSAEHSTLISDDKEITKATNDTSANDDREDIPMFTYHKRARSKKKVRQSVKLIHKAKQQRKQGSLNKVLNKKAQKGKQKRKKNTSAYGVLKSKNGPEELDQIDDDEPSVKKVKIELQPPELKPLSVCNCGKTGNNNQLTCIGQRCPCYSMKLPCLRTCKCRGCRNPKKGPDFQPSTSCSSAVLRSGTRSTAESLCLNM